MRIRHAIGFLAVALLMCLSGCSKSKTDWITITETGRVNVRTANEVRYIERLAADLKSEKAALETLRRRDRMKSAADRDMRPSGAAVRIANSITDCLAEWKEYRAGLTSESEAQRARAMMSLQASLPGHADERSISAIRRKYSSDYINLNMRIALLESRLATDELNKKPLSEKLEQARADLRAVDEKYQAEIDQEQAAEAASPEPSAQPASIDDLESVGTAGGYSPDNGETELISAQLRNSRANAELESDGGWQPTRKSAGAGYQKTLADTCNNIDRTILLLQRSRGGQAADR